MSRVEPIPDEKVPPEEDSEEWEELPEEEQDAACDWWMEHSTCTDCGEVFHLENGEFVGLRGDFHCLDCVDRLRARILRDAPGQLAHLRAEPDPEALPPKRRHEPVGWNLCVEAEAAFADGRRGDGLEKLARARDELAAAGIAEWWPEELARIEARLKGGERDS